MPKIKKIGLNLERYVHVTGEMNEVGEQFIQFFSSFTDFVSRHVPSWLPQGLQGGELLSSVLGFVTVPLIYLSSYLSNEKVPFNLKNNARWLYSGVLLGLTIAALAVPGVGPILAIVAAGLSFSVGSFIFAKTLYKWTQRRQEREALRAQLPALVKEHELLEDQINTLHAKLPFASGEEKNKLQIALNEMSDRLQSNELAAAREKAAELDLKLQSKGLSNIFDKSVGVVLASAAVVGFALSLAMPPVGLIVLLSTAAVSLTYTCSRLAFSAVARWRDARRSKSEIDVKPASEDKHKDASSALHVNANLDDNLDHSTINMINALGSPSPNPNRIEEPHYSSELSFGKAGASHNVRVEKAAKENEADSFAKKAKPQERFLDTPHH